ncbi:hypothetical protein [Qaidamihabitans albus]|uniref:hypothetical protein n=1 Tax=Qaidamihabitans albus TaxID=2795733 RepID=UPI001B35556E|nr:hypothetical protein [Qaidamihabitans albus]
MQSQVVNNHARKRYAEFESAIGTARLALDELIKFSKTLSDKSDTRFQGWQVPTKVEIAAALRKASNDLDALRKHATEYKAELVSRSWRV